MASRDDNTAYTQSRSDFSVFIFGDYRKLKYCIFTLGFAVWRNRVYANPLAAMLTDSETTSCKRTVFGSNQRLKTTRLLTTKPTIKGNFAWTDLIDKKE